MSYPEYLGEPAKLPGRGEPARPARIRDWPHAEWLAVAAVCFGAITSSLDNGVVTISYPKLESELNRPLSQIAWIVLVPQITVVATLVLFGKRADYIGRKRVYLDGFVIFIAGAIACAASPNFAFLLGARVVEALGIAMIQANSIALVASSVHEQHRTTALGVQASAQAIGLAVGPFLGGFLVPYLTWREIFLVSTPFAIVAFVASILFLPRSRTSAKAPALNVAGALVLAVAAGGIIGGITMAAKSGWTGPALGLLAVGISASIALVPVERRSPAPIFDPRLMSQRAIRRALASIVATWATFFGLLTTVPFFVKWNLGLSTSAGGAATMAVPAGLILMAPFIGTLRRHIAARRMALVATSAITVSIALSAAVQSMVPLLVALVVVGLGVGTMNTLNSASVMNGVDEQDRGVASGLINLSRAAGSAVGVALASSVMVMSGESTARGALITLSVAALVNVAIVLWSQRS